MANKTLIVSCALALLSLASPALAGPPFLCHPFDISGAKSLPWVDGRDWLGVRGDYDVTHLVADTEALLTPETPTIVRMETLRRAAIYAAADRALAERLVAALTARVHAAGAGGRTGALAIFDAGYVLEAMSELAMHGHYMGSDAGARGTRVGGLAHPDEGRALIAKSASLRTNDAGIAFALTLISKTEEQQPHLSKARAGAKQDRLLAANMARLQMQ